MHAVAYSWIGVSKAVAMNGKEPPFVKRWKDPQAVERGKKGMEKRWRDADLSATSLNKTRIEREKLKIERERRELAKLDGETVNRELVYIAWQAVADNVRAKLMPIGSKLAQIVLGMTSVPEIRETIDKEVREALAELNAFALPDLTDKKGSSRAKSARAESRRVSDSSGADKHRRPTMASAAKAHSKPVGRPVSSPVARERF